MTEFTPFKFINHHPSITEFAVPKHEYLASHSNASFGYIATSTLVLSTSSDASKPCVLLVQRAAQDEDPNLWEPPGGACDDDDETILHAAARELMEETGLSAVRFCSTIGEPFFFTLDDGKQVCQFNFVARVTTAGLSAPPPVKLNPLEHQRCVWATEDEIRASKSGDISLEFTRDEVRQTVLLVFQHASQ